MARHGERRHHMQALAAGGLAEADEAELLQPLAHFARGIDDVVEGQARAGIEIEDQPARRLPARPGAQFQGCSSSAPIWASGGQALDAVDLQIGLLVAGDLRPVPAGSTCPAWRGAGRTLAADAIGRPHDRAGPALDMGHHPGADGFEIAREIQLGHRLAVAGIGPERLVGIGDRHAHDHGLGGALRGASWVGAISGLRPVSASCVGPAPAFPPPPPPPACPRAGP